MAQAPQNAGSLIGQRLDEYELVALLALGGTAEIYLARHAGVAGFEKYVVVKCLHDHLAEDADFVRMFRDEARLGARLDHSNIVQTIKLGSHGNRYYLVQEYLPERIGARPRRDGGRHERPGDGGGPPPGCSERPPARARVRTVAGAGAAIEAAVGAAAVVMSFL